MIYDNSDNSQVLGPCPLTVQRGIIECPGTQPFRDEATLSDSIPWPVPADVTAALSNGPTRYTKVRGETTDDA
jgi:hypothetical protein